MSGAGPTSKFDNLSVVPSTTRTFYLQLGIFLIALVTLIEWHSFPAAREIVVNLKKTPKRGIRVRSSPTIVFIRAALTFVYC